MIMKNLFIIIFHLISCSLLFIVIFILIDKDSTEFAIQTIDAILEYTYTHMSEIQSLI